MTTEINCKIITEEDIFKNYLTGEVKIISTEELVIQQAVIEINGTAKCKWNLEQMLIKFPKIYHKNTQVKGKEQFYFVRNTLCGGDNPQKHIGENNYPFKCYWPTQLPATWDGEFGSIKYNGKITIKLNNDTYVHVQEILITTRRDLSLEKHLLFEARQDIRRSFNISKRQLGFVDISVWIPICGVAAGQSLPVLCTIFNESKIHFGGLLFILTRIDVYRSSKPVTAFKTVRTDICRVARIVDIHEGKYEYYSVLETDKNTLPTNQFYKCKCCQIIYEMWVSMQAGFPSYKIQGDSNINLPGIPVIIGTEPIQNYNIKEITANVFKEMYDFHPPIIMEECPPDEEIQLIVQGDEEIMDEKIIENLQRQLDENRKLLYKKNWENK